MTNGTLGQIVQRAISDAAFRRQLQTDPGAALRGFDLTADERSALLSGDPAKLSALGVDQRMSKAFSLFGDTSGTASRFSGIDVASGGTVLADESVGGLQSGLASSVTDDRAALIDGGSGLSSAVDPGVEGTGGSGFGDHFIAEDDAGRSGIVPSVEDATTAIEPEVEHTEGGQHFLNES
ncbi:MAG: Os1348 family NHLP clan protein [Candidatus Limnocylindria bacterium]